MHHCHARHHNYSISEILDFGTENLFNHHERDESTASELLGHK